MVMNLIDLSRGLLACVSGVGFAEVFFMVFSRVKLKATSARRYARSSMAILGVLQMRWGQTCLAS